MISRLLAGAASGLMVLAVSGCDRLFEKADHRAVDSATKKVAAGDYRGAVKAYEAALDGTPKTAEVHYKLAVLYDDKLHSPLDALHHFERYLDFDPNGRHAKEARTYQKEGELKLLTTLSKGSFVSQEEAARLKNENLTLRNRLVELRAQKNATPPPVTAKGEPVQKPIPPGARTHTVAKGETFAAISLKYYKTRARARDIQDANFYSHEGTPVIKPGQILVIPK